MEKNVLALDSVSKSFHGAHSRLVLRDISLAIRGGEYVAIMGESGVGKSTLLNLISGLDRPDTGTIIFDGQNLGSLNDDQATRLRRRAIGFVFQAFHVLAHLSVAQNVALPLLLNGIAHQQALVAAKAMLVEVGLPGRDDSFPRELSGGEMQKVAIARALVHRPRLLLADEPTGNLDAENATQILRLLRAQIKTSAAMGSAGLLVTHSALAAATADRVLLLTADGLVPQHQPTLPDAARPAI
ncbi:ABC transporter ATP-binding protein [Candidimonas sp. SYP-B2681]|uniref:ABC transporter ATP-binding protein n=1 Tax=Candidimonas sp. SYP-B2681 TaxID=2497686 RepID=UPI0018F3BB43|nr:ABC transporter ATP-binding protein [Candidimonas sp. SYP-B2681]